MHPHQQLIENFYTAFNKRDAPAMISCYHEEVTFYDPVFENLNAAEVAAMWTMLCKNAKDFSVGYSNVEAGNEYGSCVWVATYTFSATGRKVINRVTAHFKFHEGRIIEHMDSFDLWKWSRQALGFKGLLLGWSGFVINKVRKSAKSNLKKFMGAK
jgi:ketosteroid isomerase-like protein